MDKGREGEGFGAMRAVARVVESSGDQACWSSSEAQAGYFVMLGLAAVAEGLVLLAGAVRGSRP